LFFRKPGGKFATKLPEISDSHQSSHQSIRDSNKEEEEHGCEDILQNSLTSEVVEGASTPDCDSGGGGSNCWDALTETDNPRTESPCTGTKADRAVECCESCCGCIGCWEDKCANALDGCGESCPMGFTLLADAALGIAMVLRLRLPVGGTTKSSSLPVTLPFSWLDATYDIEVTV
jgi:hypothetical protein